jgi:hypothetical protein
MGQWNVQVHDREGSLSTSSFRAGPPDVRTAVNRFEPRSHGLPEGFPDQPFYGWVGQRNLKTHPDSAGFACRGFSRLNARAIDLSTLKRANGFVFTLDPALKPPV